MVHHKRLQRGFSIEKSPPARTIASAASTVLSAKKFPSVAIAKLSPSRSGKPSGNFSERRGGGPPSSLRAAEKLLQGVPKWMNLMAPQAISFTIKDQLSQSRTSKGDGTSWHTVISIGGRHGTPKARTAAVSRAVPEKISKNQGPCRATSSTSRGTSFHDFHTGLWAVWVGNFVNGGPWIHRRIISADRPWSSLRVEPIPGRLGGAVNSVVPCQGWSLPHSTQRWALRHESPNLHPNEQLKNGHLLFPLYLNEEILSHSFSGTRASFEALEPASFRSEVVDLAFCNRAFCLSRRALFFLARAEGFFVVDSSSDMDLLVPRTGVSGACWPACLNLSSSALERASFHNCLWLVSTSTRAVEKVGNCFLWS